MKGLDLNLAKPAVSYLPWVPSGKKVDLSRFRSENRDASRQLSNRRNPSRKRLRAALSYPRYATLLAR